MVEVSTTSTNSTPAAQTEEEKSAEFQEWLQYQKMVEVSTTSTNSTPAEQTKEEKFAEFKAWQRFNKMAAQAETEAAPSPVIYSSPLAAPPTAASTAYPTQPAPHEGPPADSTRWFNPNAGPSQNPGGS